ncbi:hypothetical protein GJ698_26015 [Pseudoduganella sp. FT26W]|uniref:Uncharacterized protein n=1 Tax=Duganella aquatilis TaxID=2666082 RepID=A0A844DE18_9BURK|nr:hypothetical protein [Duganella aquatilis]MRW87532.1 hypothetical protein [Duganella aquatilis]
MLQIMKGFNGQSARNSHVGDLNRFLRNVLVEVAAENYRQTMFEMMAVTSGGNMEGRFDLDPPLRANERVMSGLFATAISRVASRSRTEVRIDRSDREQSLAAIENKNEGDLSPGAKHGRVDFLAWYGGRVIAVELKMVGMNCESPAVTKQIRDRWAKVLDQAGTAQNYLRARQREDIKRYRAPISIALMVVVGRRNADRAKFTDLNKDLRKMQNACATKLAELTPKPVFRAIYTFPEEFRGVVPRPKGVSKPVDGRAVYTPFVLFIAKAAVNSRS